MDGHSGLALPGLISNPEVKQSSDALRTVLKNGRRGTLSTFSIYGVLTMENIQASRSIDDLLLELKEDILPDFLNLSSMVAIAQQEDRAEVEPALYKNIETYARAIKTEFDQRDAEHSRSAWFIRAAAEVTEYLAASVALLKEVSVFIRSPRVLPFFENDVEEYRILTNEVKSALFLSSDAFSKAITDTFGIKHIGESDAKEFQVRYPQQAFPVDMPLIKLAEDDKQQRMRQLADLLYEARKMYASATRTDDLSSNFNALNVLNVRNTVIKAKDYFKLKIHNTDIMEENEHFPMMIAYFKVAQLSLHASGTLLQVCERYMDDPREDPYGRKTSDLGNQSTLYDVAHKLTFGKVLPFLEEACTISCAYDPVNSVQKVMELIESDIGCHLYYKGKNGWEPAKESDLSFYNTLDRIYAKQARDAESSGKQALASLPQQFHERLALVVPQEMASLTYNPKNSIKIVHNPEALTAPSTHAQ